MSKSGSRYVRTSSVIFNVGVRVNTIGIPTKDFELVDIDGTKRVTPNGSDQGIDLSGIHQKVQINFILQDELDLRFSDDPCKSMGINHHAEGCPGRHFNAHKDVFIRDGVDMPRRQLNVRNKNNGGQMYLFSLFLYDRNNTLVAVCDPRIINN